MDRFRSDLRRRGLARPGSGRVLGGVCAGIGRRFGIDPWPARLLFVLVLMVLPGTQVQMIDRCSAMDGTWGMKSEYYELSKKVARPLFEDVKKAEADAVVTDCPLASIQIADGTGERPVHPVKILQRAYGLDA